MPKKTRIDKIFRNIARNHEENYDPRDWEDMQSLLQLEGLNHQSSWSSRMRNYFYRGLSMGVLVLLMSIPSNRSGNLLPVEDQDRQNSNPIIYREKNTTNQSSRLITRQSKPDSHRQEEEAKVTKALSRKSPEANRVVEAALLPNEKSLSISSLNLLPRLDVSLNKNTTWEAYLKHSHELLLAYNREKLNYELYKGFNFSVRKPEVSNAGGFNASLFYPLGTDGTKSNTSYPKASLSATVDVSAGSQQWALAGIGNIATDSVKGIQTAGLFNLVHNSTQGVQVAGLFNASGGENKGLQLAGLANVSNWKDEVSGQSADNSGLQIQMAGLINVDMNTSQKANAQVSSIMNIGRNVSGLQFAGLVNTAEKVRGAQISGLVNVAQRVKGVQLGLINIADTVDGVPIGLFSYVRQNGYRHLEFWGGETLHSNIGIKVGVKQFYNIFAVGTQYASNSLRWGIGYGLGTEWDLGSRSFVNFELLSYHINENRTLTRRLNLLSQFKANFGKPIGNHFNLFGGPSVNLLVSDFKNENNTIGSRIAPWTFYRNFTEGISIQAWVGFNVGIRF